MDTSPGTTVFAGTPDLACADLGGEALLASDAFFAGPENLLFAHEPEWREDAFTERGKWMDGWEPRRRRAPGHDWCIVRLGVPGDLVGVDVDTRFFTGNHAPYASLDAVTAPADASPEWLRDEAKWTPVLDQTALERGGHNVFALRPFAGATHVRLNIYPAGGVARLRVHGRPALPPSGDARIDLASVTQGGQALASSDSYFCRPDNLILPHEAPTMGHGWETKRSPLPKSDWVVLALGTAGLLEEVVIDTRHFKGNYPESAQVEALHWPDAPPHALTASDAWRTIVPPTPLGADRAHPCPVTDAGPWTHLKVTILTDGGFSRLRAWGRPAERAPAEDDALLTWLNGCSDEAAQAAFARCCGARRWVAGMLAGRPYQSRTHLHGHAEHVWWHLGDGDWREAFTHHPQIGADVAKLRERFAATAGWSEGEQSGVQGADEETLAALAADNQAYADRYGYIFIVCASGLTAGEMLARLRGRLDNPPEFELRVAAGEQAKITALRLEKLEVPQ
jgi:allantoicase